MRSRTPTRMYPYAYAYANEEPARRKVRDVNAREVGALDVSRNVWYLHVYEDVVRVYAKGGRGGLSVMLASSGHHRRRTVGMVGNDPVMTLTPRIADTRGARRVYACMCTCVRVGALSFSLPAPPPPGCPSRSFFFSRGYPWSGPKAPMMHGETFVFAF